MTKLSATLGEVQEHLFGDVAREGEARVVIGDSLDVVEAEEEADDGLNGAHGKLGKTIKFNE